MDRVSTCEIMGIKNSDALLTTFVHKDAYIDYIENIINSIDQSIMVLDNQERVMLWNSMMEETFGNGNVFGKTLRDIFPAFWEEYKGLIVGNALLDNIFHKGEKYKIPRFPLKIRGEKIRYFDLKASPLKDSQGEIVGMVVIIEDVTGNIHSENQLVRHARTTSLANLGASIAHEIRNPLNSISLNIQLIKEGLQQPSESSQSEMMEIVNNVLSEIARLNDLIRYFLKFSRLPDPNRIPDNLNLCVEQSLKLLAEDAKRANVEIIEKLGNIPEIAIDRNLLSQAIYNISLNAIQAMKPQGGGKLEITTLSTKEYVLLQIKDNGPGFAPEIKEKLFELFFTTKEEGSGLGLAITSEIVEKHDGKIVAENNLDRGACFSVYLPYSSQQFASEST